MNDCKAKRAVRPDRVGGFWSGLLLLLVPKCPFCYMAFSTTLVFCGKDSTEHFTRTFHSVTTLLITGIFCTAALLSILLYYRPRQGKYALWFCLPGIAAVLFSVTSGGGMILYYTGVIVVLTGILRNSGAWFLLKKKSEARKNLRMNYSKITFSG
jgi:hypothetical protein